jgi:anaerobic selenocysteine-containing dehydrogenase
MEINRRHFIALLAGGAVGTHITPLPWKLTDDIAIWTQNWSWVPVPPKGQFTHVNSICHLCPGGCGIEVRKVDNRAVKIEGRIDYPVNPGGICPVGMGGLQLLYNESIRYTGPMKRVGPRGSGEFIDITWDEAVELLAGRISGLRDNGTPEALVAVDGNPIQATMSVMIERLLRAVGSPNYMRVASAEETYRMTNLLMQGTEGPMAYDLENADYVLSFGSGLLEGWGAPGRVINAWSLWRGGDAKKKVKIVQIESRASNTASKADQWVAPKPGTEAALALGLAHVIIKNRLYDAEFINAHCFGFHDWSSSYGENHMGFKTMVLEKYSPSQVAEITGLSVKNIVSLAKEFATAKAPIATCGKGKGALPGSLYEFMAVHSLNALVGNINRPGGVLVHDPLPLSPLAQIEEDAIASDGLRNPRIDRAGNMQYPFTQSLINNLTDAILESPNSPVNTLLVFSANPAHTLPDGGRFKRALKRIPFIVSFSPFRDETSYMADLILPDHLYLEKTDDIVWPAGLQYPLYGLSKPVLDPIYSTRHSGEVIIQLAKAIGGAVASAFPWHNYEAVLKERVKGLFDSGAGSLAYDGSLPVWQMQKAGKLPRFEYESFDEMWKKIWSQGLWYKPTHVYKNWKELFNTTTGKFEFFSTRLELAVQDYAEGSSEAWALKRMEIAARGDSVFMPHYEEATAEVDPAEYPLLMVPYEIINLASGWVPNAPHLNKTIFDDQLRKDESFAEINPTTAQEYGLKEGDRVIIHSPAGKVQVRVNLFEGAMPGVVFLPLGFGHTAYDEFSQGKGVNPNDIILPGKDPLSGHPVWWKTPVQLTKFFDS